MIDEIPAPPVPLEFSDFHERKTGGETKLLRWACVEGNGAFWGSWKRNRFAWIGRGYSASKSKVDGKWYCLHWLTTTFEASAKAKEIAEEQQRLKLVEQDRAEALKGWSPKDEIRGDLIKGLYPRQVKPAMQILHGLMSEEGMAGAWDSSDLGTGKTYQALAAALTYAPKIGVICPPAVIPAWKAAFRHFRAHAQFVLNYESLRGGKRSMLARSGKTFTWRMWDLDDWCLIWDEAHNCKNVETLNQAMMIAAIEQGIASIDVSGTIAENPTHMYATGQTVGLHTGNKPVVGKPSWPVFLGSHNCAKNERGWYFRGDRTALLRIHNHVFPMNGARVRIADLGDEFPETQVLCEAFETGKSKEIDQAYERVVEYAEKLKSEGRAEKEVKAAMRKGYMEARKESEMLKIPALIAMVKEELEAHRHCAIFCNFNDSRIAVMEALKTTCGIYGGQKPEQRQRCIEEFQADRAPVIVCNITAGGVGVSLHDLHGNHPRTAIIFPSPMAVAVKQALGRVHRAGGLTKSRQIVFFAAGTIEDGICETVREKIANMDSLNDGDLNPEEAF